MGQSRKAYLIDKFPHLTYEEICELKRLLEAEKTIPNGKAYQLALALMMAEIEIRLLDKGEKC